MRSLQQMNVEGETRRIQGTICGRDAFECLQVSSGRQERNLENVLTDHIIVSSVGGQASNRMQRI